MADTDRDTAPTHRRHGRTALAPMLIAALGGLVAAACTTDHEGLGTITALQLAERMKQDASLVVLDANASSVRRRYGIVPGAVLLSGASSYDADSELPADRGRPLVFYCVSQRCSAAPAAARRARDAGFTEVLVMPEGIRGWVEVGMPVAKAPAG